MPEYWLDADSLIMSHRGPYRFGMVKPFWDFIEIKAREGVLASPEIILEMELTAKSKNQDLLQQWAKELKGVLFIPVDNSVQTCYSRIADHVQNCGKYRQQWIAEFLGGADPWVIAYPVAIGGKIVTFEKSEPRSTHPKIPDIANQFGIECLTLYDMLSELGFKL